MDTYTPTNFRKNIYNILKDIVKNKSDVEISVKGENQKNDQVVVMSKERYDQLKELEYLMSTGILDTVLKRMDNEKPDDFSEENAY